MNDVEIENIKNQARKEGRREEAKSQFKQSILQKLFEFAVGAAIGGYIGYKVSPTPEGVLIGAGIGGVVFTGVWVFFL